MEISLFLAKVIGLCFILFAISMFTAKSYYFSVMKHLAKDPAIPILAGSINLIIGVLLVVSHNVWQMNWTVLITLIGWLTLIRGFALLTLPNKMLAMAAQFSERKTAYKVSLVVVFIVGIILCYYGFK